MESESFAGVTLTFSEEEIQKRNDFEFSLNVLNFISEKIDLSWSQFRPELLEFCYVTRVKDLDHSVKELVLSFQKTVENRIIDNSFESHRIINKHRKNNVPANSTQFVLTNTLLI